MEKRNVNINRPELTSEEIAKHKDFDALLSQFNAQQSAASETVVNSKGVLQSIWVKSLMVLVATGVIVYWVASDESNVESEIQKNADQMVETPMKETSPVLNALSFLSAYGELENDQEAVVFRPNSTNDKVYLNASEWTVQKKSGDGWQQLEAFTVESMSPPVEPLQASKNGFVFDIAINEEQFPELADYRSTLFEVKAGQGFSKANYDKVYEDIKLIKKSPNAQQYQVALKHNGKWEKFDVDLVLMGRAYEEAIKKYKMEQDLYTKNVEAQKHNGEIQLDGAGVFKIMKKH